MGKIAILQRTLREDHEAITKLKGMCPDNRIPAGLLREGSDAIKDGKIIILQIALEAFNKAKSVDEMNEKRPDIEKK